VQAARLSANRCREGQEERVKSIGLFGLRGDFRDDDQGRAACACDTLLTAPPPEREKAPLSQQQAAVEDLIGHYSLPLNHGPVHWPRASEL